MADIRTTIERFNQQLSSLGGGDVGRATLHSLFPRDFEYYMVALELTDSGDNTIDYFTFPVMPSSISKSENTRVNVKKTATSTVVINSKHFVPHDITMSGDFGRTFKILLKPAESISFKALRYSFKSGVYNSYEDPNTVRSIIPEFTPQVKTGYGCTKILQGMISKASGVDGTGKPHKLYMYNPALGESYRVVPTQNPLSLQQDSQQQNMVWKYTLNLTIVAEVGAQPGVNNQPGALTQLLAANTIQTSMNKTGRAVGNFISSSAQ